VNSIEAVNKFCCLNAISLILAWDNAELGRYVETITVLLKETGIGECNNLDFLTITFSTLSEITCLNKLDVSTFINIFPDLLIVLNTSVLGFASVPGIGMQKAQHITSLVQNAFH
jgi:DNA integrity scanning protein DisA with diadenylate cyclase activity